MLDLNPNDRIPDHFPNGFGPISRFEFSRIDDDRHYDCRLPAGPPSAKRQDTAMVVPTVTGASSSTRNCPLGNEGVTADHDCSHLSSHGQMFAHPATELASLGANTKTDSLRRHKPPDPVSHQTGSSPDLRVAAVSRSAPYAPGVSGRGERLVATRTGVGCRQCSVALLRDR